MVNLPVLKLLPASQSYWKRKPRIKKKIRLIFNQAFESITPEAGFSVTINDSDATITDIILEEDTPQMIVISLDNILEYNDEVLVSYSGQEVTTKSGVVLATFTNEPVEVSLEGGIVPIAIPGKIEAENFNVNSGFETEETQDISGGLNLGYTDNGDYLD